MLSIILWLSGNVILINTINFGYSGYKICFYGKKIVKNLKVLSYVVG